MAESMQVYLYTVSPWYTIYNIMPQYSFMKIWEIKKKKYMKMIYVMICSDILGRKKNETDI